MNERTLATKMRIKIIEELADIDLPGFLFEHLDQSISELNYFKLTNLHKNISSYCTYLEDLSKQYTQYILQLVEESVPVNTYSKRENELFMTESIYQQYKTISLSKKDMIKITSLFSVSCLLTMKEYINRRIISSTKQKKSIPTKKLSHA